MKRILFLALVGVVGFLLSLSMQRKSPVQKSLLVTQPAPAATPTKIKDTRVISGKLDALVSSSLTVTTRQGTQYQVDLNPKTFVVWQDLDKGERIVLTPYMAEPFLKSRDCWVSVGVDKGIASDVIIHPVVADVIAPPPEEPIDQ